MTGPADHDQPATPWPPPGFAGPLPPVRTGGALPPGFAGAFVPSATPAEAGSQPPPPGAWSPTSPDASPAPGAGAARPVATRTSRGPFVAAVVGLVLVVGIGALVALRGGDGDIKADPSSPEGVVAAAAAAIEANDADALCSHLTTHAVSQVSPTPGTPCAELAAPVLASVPDGGLSDLKIERSAIDGTRATVHVVLGDETQDLQLVRTGTRWRIDNVGFVTLLGLSPSAYEIARLTATTADLGPNADSGPNVDLSPACIDAQHIVRAAIATYAMRERRLPRTLEDLVPNDLGRVPLGVELTADGHVVPAGPCA